MKLCAIYNVWNDIDLLKLSIDNIIPVVDGVIIIYSKLSNNGEEGEEPDHKWNAEHWKDGRFFWINSFRCEPDLKLPPQKNETRKRNYGLEKALEYGFTHFITMDADEFYRTQEFSMAREMFHEKPDLAGLVVESQVYFKSPTLTIGKDVTLVPHIHKLTPTIKHEFNKQYPFAWINGQIRIDPTRSFNINSGVEMFDCTMHHMSWVRTDYEKKIRNSTARANLTRSSIVHDLVNAKEGEMCHFYGKRLLRVANRFNIPEYGEEGIRTLAENIQLQQSVAAADKAPQPKRG